MRNVLSVLLITGVMIAVAGCGTKVPPKLEVRDLTSGKEFTTYQPWARMVKGSGYQFTDIATGSQITLTNYEVKTLEAKKSVPSDSPEARAFREAKERGGVKD